MLLERIFDSRRTETCKIHCQTEKKKNHSLRGCIERNTINVLGGGGGWSKTAAWVMRTNVSQPLQRHYLRLTHAAHCYNNIACTGTLVGLSERAQLFMSRYIRYRVCWFRVIEERLLRYWRVFDLCRTGIRTVLCRRAK